MILCADPDSASLDSTRGTLENGGFDTVGRQNLSGALSALEQGDIDCVVTEYDLGDGTGLELIESARETAPDAVCVLYTSVDIGEIDTTAFGNLVAEYVPKEQPNADEELVELVEHSLRLRTQTAYPLPDDEDERLAALERYATDATDLAASLDRLSELATALFDTQSAGVGIIDAHEERFLSCHGASFGSLNREDTICTHTILDDEVTVVAHVSDDPRFSGNEDLVDAGIEFYAGTPLLTPDGRAIGVFCLHDDEPGTFSDRDRYLLSLLADEAMEQLELRRQLAAARGDGDG